MKPPTYGDVAGKPGVYLLHFQPRYHHARHYTGTAEDIMGRMVYHAHGIGSRLVAAVLAAGHHVVIARVWPKESRPFERKLKNTKNVPRYCPICNGEIDPADCIDITPQPLNEIDFGF